MSNDWWSGFCLGMLVMLIWAAVGFLGVVRLMKSDFDLWHQIRRENRDARGK